MATKILPATVFEITPEPEFPHVCRDCGAPMEVLEQPLFRGGSIDIITCRTSDCLLNGVTLSPKQYTALTESQLQDYRVMVAKHNATLVSS